MDLFFLSYFCSWNRFILYLLLDRRHRDFGLSQIFRGELSFLQKEIIFLSVHSFHHQKRVVPPWPVYNQPQLKRGKTEELKKPLNKTRRRRNMKTAVSTPYRGEVDELMITILFFHSCFSKYTRDDLISRTYIHIYIHSLT